MSREEFKKSHAKLLGVDKETELNANLCLNSAGRR
jgi:hypothetical protein